MAKSLQGMATDVLHVLAKLSRDEIGRSEADWKTIAKMTRLSPAEVNDAVSLLVHSGYAEWRKYIGTSPFIFGAVGITPVDTNTRGHHPLLEIDLMFGHETWRTPLKQPP
jgi:hypothetical protein